MNHTYNHTYKLTYKQESLKLGTNSITHGATSPAENLGFHETGGESNTMTFLHPHPRLGY